MIEFDNAYRGKSIHFLAGVDEAGRGPLAGPVVAAAVILPPKVDIPGVDDSKKLTSKKRDILFSKIESKALAIGIEMISNVVIDEINILQASLLAMKSAVAKLTLQPEYILVDGNKTFSTEIPVDAVVKGDSKSLSIAAASIVAKVVRDRFMIELSESHPGYAWEKNKGYGTAYHREAIAALGTTPYHRKTFLNNILHYEQRKIK